ncbi:hypothetical protein [Paracoccus cavernae]|uniref:hypothetical protein n=1 Tax=Paracoccus cavernae TaxID=1571207 RepID=UPI00362DD71A
MGRRRARRAGAWLDDLCLGAGAGVLAFALGLSVLVWQPLDAWRRRREAYARAHSVPPTAAE